MAAQSTDDDELITAINVVPLVDIVLVLLVIFMVMAQLIASRAIKVELPRATSGESIDTQTLGIALTREGVIVVEGVPTDYEQLAGFLRERKMLTPDLQALISADAQVPHGEVIRLIDLIKTNGVTQFAFNIDPKLLEEPAPKAELQPEFEQ